MFMFVLTAEFNSLHCVNYQYEYVCCTLMKIFNYSYFVNFALPLLLKYFCYN